jgi:hypothetical protein
MDDVPPELKFNFNRLLKLLHQQKPYNRPDAEETRQVASVALARNQHCLFVLISSSVCSALPLNAGCAIDPISSMQSDDGTDRLGPFVQVIESLEEALNGDSGDNSNEQETLLQKLEARAQLGEMLLLFYQRYGPDRVKQVPGLLRKFVGKEHDLNAELRSKYNADLSEFAPPKTPRSMRPANESARELGSPRAQYKGTDYATAADESYETDNESFKSRLFSFFSINAPALIPSVEEQVVCCAPRFIPTYTPAYVQMCAEAVHRALKRSYTKNTGVYTL